ncbi:RTA1 like protein-domain-containing protein [Suillus subalutaceus]|uniref:RTA1 like protein-domain-containing protein n=1 Tax=Suillus subalutaceus TaxID=48586 RepID=UPI001B87B2E6|nr:RTA1 like protein-domain-containing protein [Suillus subalutaceus]KAG1847156.1 RTA1 like protein-domain-containing protein [Suillus subalutaceus]
MIPTATFAGIVEIFGWSARLWSSQNPEILMPYEMQLVGTVLAPTPLVAAIFVIFGRIIKQLGPQFSRLVPNMCWCYFDDVICLIVQAVGGALAAQAVNENEGGNIMLGGISAQFISVYRTVELADGWSGSVIANESYFNWLDGGFVTLAIYTLNIVHPGIYLKRDATVHISKPDGDEFVQDYAC